MNNTLHLRTISIVCLVIAGIAIGFDIFEHSNLQFRSLGITMVLLVTALETIRLELRDIRAEILKRGMKAEKDSPQTI